ncbi:MAG: molecular chaperone TorD family protein [SAR324 cluster bacterium]|nr:molecular chaperone TorD family protein [SAR324 cluster bacterium]MBL7034826.1 molecular chaperone TorD family protein [SAR324 cluster bacterium]
MYAFLGRLLRSVPDDTLFEQLAAIESVSVENNSVKKKQQTKLAQALGLLKLAAKNVDNESLEEEYHALFIGLGRGELVPFGSWYQTGYLMEKPLGVLRLDLQRLGFERQEGVHEPEDHVAALCEVMSMLILSEGSAEDESVKFFRNHMEPWIERFYNDLEEAENACFYRSVGTLGAEFNRFEKQYLAMLS